MFISTVPLKLCYNSQTTFEDFVKSVSLTQMSVFRHQKYPYAKLLESLKKKYNFTQNLYEVALSYQNARNVKDENTVSYECNWSFSGHCSDSLQIHFYDIDNTGILNIYYDYQIHKLDKNTICHMHHKIMELCDIVLKNPSILVEDLEMIYADEKKQILEVFNDSYLEHPKDTNIYDLIEEIGGKNPNHIAITDDTSSITYQELLEKSYSIAQNLMSKNIKKADCVAVYFSKKNIAFICSILGVLKAGGCFLAIYPDYPEERIKYMLEDSKAKLIITDKTNAPTLFGIPTVYISNPSTIPDANAIDKVCFPHACNDDVAYLIYTSGSTGKPKGTMQTHNNLINFVYSFQHFLDNSITPKDHMLCVTNICFDVSVAEIFTPLLFGATLFLYKDLNTSSSKELADYIMKNAITFSYFPPSMLQSIYEELKRYDTIPLNKMLVGVEPIKVATLLNFLSLNPHMKIVNGYGPSETTICCTMYPFDPNLPPDQITPIGKPIANSKILILDANKHLVPIGHTGEIYVQGECVGNGYLNNLEATKASFDLENKIYKTGDLAKWLPSGDILFVGRNDDQIKYRGYRIDLGEIEQSVQNMEDVQNCTVLLDNENENSPRLACFMVLKQNANLKEEEIRQYLTTFLPHYMIPNQFIFLDCFPLTPNGKIDKKALLALSSHTMTPYAPPTNALEEKLAKLWCQVLEKEKIGIHDNFFEIGGDSLNAIKIVTLAMQEGISLSAQNFYTYPTIQLLVKNCLMQIPKEPTGSQNYITSILNTREKVSALQGDVLLIGATGFLGAHILYEFIQQTNHTIYCLVRGNSKEHAESRLKERISCYFGEKLHSYFGNRIVVINGDFSKEHFGISKQNYEFLCSHIKTVLNSAAIVKHIGDYQYFYKNNVVSVENLIAFCKCCENAQLVHISTLSVSGNSTSLENHDFLENTLYIGQNIQENVYIQTKFEAEQLLAKHILNGFNATIFRLGNITWRSTDGIFQMNENENLFYTLLNFILQTKKLPTSCKNLMFNISPVNECARFMIDILQKANKHYIYHIYNFKLYSLEDIVNMLNCAKFSIEFADSVQIENILEKYLARFPYVVEQFSMANRKNNICVSSNTTKKIAEEISFDWTCIDANYMKKKFGGLK